MNQENGINQGLTLERPLEENSAPLSPEQQLLQQARVNPSAYIKELVALAECDRSAEAGMAAIMLMLVYTKQKDVSRAVYYQGKAEQCSLNADAHLALAKMLRGEGELSHLKAALKENHVPTIKYILKDRRKEYEDLHWHAFLADTAALWSRHPENTDEFEREDAVSYARLWGTEPDLQVAAQNQKDAKRAIAEGNAAHTASIAFIVLIALAALGFLIYAFVSENTGLIWGTLIGGGILIKIVSAIKGD